MRQYAAKRIALFVPTVLLITIIVFVVMRLVPGDPAIAILEAGGGGNYTQEDLDRLRAELGTNRNIAVQYFDWIGDIILRGDFGDSLKFEAPVMTELGKRIPRTIELAVLSTLLALVVAVPMGIISALKPDSWLDYGARVFTLVGIAVPNFMVGVLLLLLLLYFGRLPEVGYKDLWDDPLTNLNQMIFPALALAFYEMAFIARVTRSSMLEILREDYMRTARSKGLAETAVILRHGLKNAFLPILTISGWQFGRLFGGTVVIETIFLIPGMGEILIDSISFRDYPTIQAEIVIIGAAIVTINLMVDLLYGLLDPRIRYA